MSYSKRAFENQLYELGPVDVFDWLIDNGWDEDEAFDLIAEFFGEH